MYECTFGRLVRGGLSRPNLSSKHKFPGPCLREDLFDYELFRGDLLSKAPTAVPTEPYHGGIGNVDEEAVMAVVRSRVSTVVVVIILVWLVIGVIAAVQRGYFGGSDTNCAKVGTTIVTIISGPLNYVGVNPKLDCTLPQPSQ